MDEIKVKVIRAFYLNGEAQPVGRILDLPKPQAVEMIAYGKAELVTASTKPKGKKAEKETEA